MKLALKLAYRNLIGAGLRTWLNVVVLSFSFVIIIWLKGVLMGWDYQAKTDMKQWQIAEGQWWHEAYDPFDPLSIQDSHAELPNSITPLIDKGLAEPMLFVQASIFPEGRMQSVILKGIRPEQQLFRIPSIQLDTISEELPALIGHMMAKSCRLKKGDIVTIRWRDANGTFDARDVVIAGVFASNVPAIENAQVYIPLAELQKMTLLTNQATIISFSDEKLLKDPPTSWLLKDKTFLTKQVDEMIKTKSSGQTVMYMILLFLAMLAIFDTQVLSIFRRQKEIGTYIALGYTRRQVVGLFTIEGSMHAVFAAFVGAFYGIPFLSWQAKAGWTMPMDTSEFGMAIAQTLYPMYSLTLVFTTVFIVLLTTAIVSYLPSRKIAKMNPTEALRGKLQ
jgi:putative ABC transport system permease protein